MQRHLFACRPCWYRLPVTLRRPINEGYVQAMAAAIEWYQANPPAKAARP